MRIAPLQSEPTTLPKAHVSAPPPPPGRPATDGWAPRVGLLALGLVALLFGGAPVPVLGQTDPAQQEDLFFHTFSIAGVDPATGESGVAVTTRVPCVGNAVPWVRAGVGAVATQAWTRVAYGPELLDALEQGTDPVTALSEGLADDDEAHRRQVAVIRVDGAQAQHTGAGMIKWAGQQGGMHYVAQGNLLVGPEVLEAVAAAFETSAGSAKPLSLRLLEAMEAGQAAGGDARAGRAQSAALLVADPRPGASRRPDGVSVSIHVCEHATPVGEVRRIYDTVSETLGYRTLQQIEGGDVWQLKVILHILGYFRPGTPALAREDDRDWRLLTPETVAAVDRFREDRGLATSAVGTPAGLVDRQTVDALWTALEERGEARRVREILLDVTRPGR